MTVIARSAARGYQHPDLRKGNVDIPGCVSASASRVQLISPEGLKQWAMWSLGIKNAFLQADGIGREVYVRAPCEWTSKDGRRNWGLRAPANGDNGAPVAFHRPLKKNLVNSEGSFRRVGPRFEAAPSDPGL